MSSDDPQQPNNEVPDGRGTRLAGFIERPRKAVWQLALPMIGGFTVHAVYGVVDMAFIGQLGPAALAAATFVHAPFFIAIAIANGLAAGITAKVAQAVGRDDAAAADRVASGGITLGLILGGLLAFAGLLGGRHAMPMLGAEGESARLAWAYFQLIAAGVPLVFISSVLRSVLTGEGDARGPMVVISIGTMINLGLDPLFIFVFGWGIRGAAWATLVAQGLSGVLLALLFTRRRRVFAHFRLRALWPSWETTRAVAGIGLPAALGQIVMAMGAVLNNRLLATFGQVTVAGYGAASRVDMLVALPILGLGGGALSVVGMFAGAGRVDLVRSTTLYTYRSVVIVALVAGASAFLLSDVILSLFTTEAHAIAVGKQYLGFMVFAYPLMAFGITSGRILQGLGHGMPTLIITIVRVLVVGVGGAYLSVLVFGAPISAVWISMISGGVAANLLAGLWVRRYVWLQDPTRLAMR